jgi:hypothetical protein
MMGNMLAWNHTLVTIGNIAEGSNITTPGNTPDGGNMADGDQITAGNASVWSLISISN